MKDAYYFTHDSNAKDDPKCMMLIETLQLEGYGIFWMLVETLRDQPEYRYPLILIPALARRYNTTAEKIKAVIHNYGLFVIDHEEFFYSESLNTRMIAWDNSKEKFRIAGIASGKARRIKALEHRSNNVATSVELIDKSREDKKRVNKSKKEVKHKYGEYKHVLLTDIEYEKLSKKLDVKYWINYMDERIEMKGYKYKSHYLAILDWYRGEQKKKKDKTEQDTFRPYEPKSPISELISEGYQHDK